MNESFRSMGDIPDVSRIFIFPYQPVSDAFKIISRAIENKQFEEELERHRSRLE